MSDTEDRNPLAERLGAQRLSAPGLLSRSALESRYDTLTRAASPNGLVEKLHRRAAFSANTGGSFVWSQARGVPSGSEPMPTVSATPVQAPMATTASPKGILQRKELPAAIAPAVNPSPVQTPDLSHAVRGEAMKGQVKLEGAEVKVEAGEVRSEASATPLVLPTPTPSPRNARERVGVRGNERSSTLPPMSASAPPMIMRKEIPSAPRAPLSSPPTPAPTPASSPTAQQPDSPIAAAIRRAPMPTVIARKPASDAPSFLSQSVSAPLVPAYRSAPTISARASGSKGSTASMLMRRLEDPRPSNTPQFAAPPLAPQRPSDQVAQQETKAAPTGPDESAVESYGQHADNDALADRVSQRILRRLEIERERRGERTWR